MDQPTPNSAPEQPVASAPAPASAPVSPPAANAPGASNGLAIAALVLGIIAFLFGWTGFLNLLVAVLAVVFGIIALVKHQSKGLALTGTILGGLGLLTSLVVGLFFSAALLSGIQEAGKSSSSSSSSSVSGWDVNAVYEKISNGMTKAEVESATGKSSENCTSSESSYGKYETCNYGSTFSDNGVITVSYTDGKVTTKSKYEN